MEILVWGSLLRSLHVGPLLLDPLASSHDFIGNVLALGRLIIDWFDFIVNVFIVDESVGQEQ